MARKTRKLGLRHFAAKTVDLNHAVDWESIITEIFVGILLGVFAYMGYVAKIALLFFPCLVGSLACVYAIGNTVYLHWKDKAESKKSGDAGPKS